MAACVLEIAAGQRVPSSERVFRAVLEKWWDPISPTPGADAFRPTRRDTTGLSVLRSSLTTVEVARIGPNPANRYHLAELLVADIESLGLTVVAEPKPEDPSHAVIPELSLNLYESRDKVQRKEILVGLAGKAIAVYRLSAGPPAAG